MQTTSSGCLIDTEAHFKEKIHSLDLFDPKTEKRYSFSEYFANAAPFFLQDVVAFTSNGSGQLAFLTNDHDVTIYDGQWRRFQLASLEDKQVFELRWGPNDWLWLTSDDGSVNQEKGRLLQAFDLEGEQKLLARHRNAEVLHIQEFDKTGNCRYLISNSGASTSELKYLRADGI